MKIAVLRCCSTSIDLLHYESSTNAVLKELGIGTVDVREFKCCGYPLRNFNFKAYVLASARNLALAEKRSLDVLTVCNCCFGSLKHAEHVLREDPGLRDHVNAALAREGLSYEGRSTARHFLQLLHDDVGVEAIDRRIKRRFHGLKVATHYGCHILRPRNVVEFDNPLSPVKFDRLVEVTGAESIPWPTKLDCCGSPLLGVNDDLALSIMGKKMESARNAGADCLCVTCPYCQFQFGRARRMAGSAVASEGGIPSVLYPQLLGLSLGIKGKALGLKAEELPPALLSAA